jgi:MFS superfamily sulfate permease-like transporter
MQSVKSPSILSELKNNWKADLQSGFMVFLLALPLSLGIARASEFPPAMGVFTAMIGGLVVSIFAGSALTIKGPAAGLITISAAAVSELGGGYAGWQLASAAIVIAAFIQILLGILKFGNLSDFFPHSVVHGMLAAIGLIIFSKQIHILLGIDPATLAGLEPLELLLRIPDSIVHEDLRVTALGVLSLLIIFGLPHLKSPFFRKMPAPIFVLLTTIPLAWIMDFKHTEPAFDMVQVGDFWSNIGVQANFSAIGTWTFWKFVIMFLFVGSLESLLTVKAIDHLDPQKRISNPNRDLTAVGIGNVITGIMGGLPMISEVARSSANISFGGKTRWSNFFHGAFLLIAMLFFIPVIEMIPNTALAALLIAVGYRLASPNEFFKTYKIGSEQLALFVFTMIVTVATDLLIGVAAGIALKFVFNWVNGAPLRSLFKARYTVNNTPHAWHIHIYDAALFSNLIGFKKLFRSIPQGLNVVFDFSGARMVDHTFMEALYHFQQEYAHHGGEVSVAGFEQFRPLSNHPLAARKYDPEQLYKIEIRLNERQIQLREFSRKNGFTFFPQRVLTGQKFAGFTVQNGARIHYEENLLEKYTPEGRFVLSDISVGFGAGHSQSDYNFTVLTVSELPYSLPDFNLEPENLWTRLKEHSTGKDIDFSEHPEFSAKYYLRSNEIENISTFFTKELIEYLEGHEPVHIESHNNKLLVYRQLEPEPVEEIQQLLHFVNGFLQLVPKNGKS